MNDYILELTKVLMTKWCWWAKKWANWFS